ncbi:VOC family protein [Bacillaceae bacterium SIJ1]|uniref:VOC family protein n=1 Tax=Litoribacterium kuwaitense TaxID=1398745 RepID=UPI0013EA46CA|nr:VOC family protein [Litoribacterium kuwaitense]NGP46100.1 VOC family protein [Litoribacterium kuwaitense]
MIKRVEHVAIMATDMEESIAFYENLLGFQTRIKVNRGDKEIVFLTHDGLPGFEIELIRDVQQEIKYSADGLVNHVAFVVDDVEQVMKKLQQEGIRFHAKHPKEGIGRKTIRFQGPNGETLQFVGERHSSQE